MGVCNNSCPTYYTFSHLTSPYDDEECEDFDDVTLTHPGDRIGDAGLEDDENVQTDWSKIYRVENKVDSEVSAASSRPEPRLTRRTNLMKKNNKVTFKDDFTQQGKVQTVFAELNPAALLLEARLQPQLTEQEEQSEDKSEEHTENDSTVAELSDDIDSDDFNVDNLKSKWSKM